MTRYKIVLDRVHVSLPYGVHDAACKADYREEVMTRYKIELDHGGGSTDSIL